MGIFSKDIKTLDDLFVHMLRDIYYAEKQILKNLPDLIDKASNTELRDGLSNHLEETRGQLERIEEVFRMHGAAPKAVDCPAIDGILKETREIVGDAADVEVRDAAIIAAAQAVEHYEITRYGTLIAFARQLGREDCAGELEATLEEEKAADHTLTEIAESRVNEAAVA